MNMKELSQIIAEIGNRIGNEGYYLLYLAIEEAVKIFPRTPSMKTVCAKIMSVAGKKSPETVYRAIARAVDDIWSREDSHKALSQYYRRPLLDKPVPKELIATLARYLWEESKWYQPSGPVNYSVFEAICPTAYGILAHMETTGLQAATTPFSQDRDRVKRLVEFLNQKQVPFERFRELFLSGNMLQFSSGSG